MTKVLENKLPPPICHSMILCDHMWQDPITGKRTIIGTFNDLRAPGFPVRHPQLHICILLTEGHGIQPMRLRIVDVDESYDPIFEANESIRFNDPRSVTDIAIVINELEFPRPAEYRIQLFVAGEFITERKLLVHLNS